MTIPKISSLVLDTNAKQISTDVFMVKSASILVLDQHYDRVILGVDPGTKNLGLAFIQDNTAKIYEIELVKRDTSAHIIYGVWNLLDAFKIYPELTIIEGASYNESFGQVDLETVRSAVVGWFIMRNYWNALTVKVVPPLTIRKIAFGSAKIKNPWDNLPDHAAAALGCALYGEIHRGHLAI